MMINNKENTRDRIEKMFPKDLDKCSMIETLLGASMILSTYLSSKEAIEDMPYAVKYSVIVIAANLLAYHSGEPTDSLIDLREVLPIVNNEQEEEFVYRKMKHILDKHYKYIQEREKEFNSEKDQKEAES